MMNDYDYDSDDSAEYGSPMFWGLTVEPKKTYSKTVLEPFHISTAAIDPVGAEGGIVSLYVIVDEKKYLLCSLNAEKPQFSINSKFGVGEEVSFLAEGSPIAIHLTGYNEKSPYSYDPELDDEDDSELEEATKELREMVAGKRLAMAREEDESSEDDEDDDVTPYPKIEVLAENDESNSDSDSESEADEETKALFEKYMEGVTNDDSKQFINFDDCKQLNKKEEKQGKAKKAKVEEESKKKKEKKKEKAEVSKKDKTEQQQQQQQQKEKDNKKKEKTKKETQQQQEKKPSKVKLAGGTVIEDLVVGKGAVAKPGKTVGMYYIGRFAKNNKVFDSCLNGQPFKFKLGYSEVIKGWDTGVNGMKVGGKRILTCPASQAYGPAGIKGTIPPNSTLVFECQLKSVR